MIANLLQDIKTMLKEKNMLRRRRTNMENEVKSINNTVAELSSRLEGKRPNVKIEVRHARNFLSEMSSDTITREFVVNTLIRKLELELNRQHAKYRLSTLSPFKCGYCSKSFRRPDKLEVHTRIHTGHKPFKCTFDDCGKSFTQRSHLNTHAITYGS